MEKNDQQFSKNINNIKEKKEKEQNEKQYQTLVEELNKANNLLDYFLVIGVPPDIFTKDWLYESDLEELNTTYKKELEPKIISYFPPITKETISFDESIINHCFPNGFKIIEDDEQPKPKIFSFILDNNYYNLNFPKKYLSCFLFYEKIDQYKKLYDQYLKLSHQPNVQINKKEKNKDKNKNEDNDSESTNGDIYIPKCLLVMSLYPYFGEFEKILSEIYNYSIGISIEEEKKPEENKRSASPNQRKIIPQSIQLTKAKTIFNCNKNEKKDITLPIEKMIENLLIELPVPPRGIYRLEYSLNNQKRKLHQNEMNKLPLVNINLKKIFADFEIKDIIDIYRHLFLEARLLFFSEKIELLNIYIFSFLTFLYPFDYQYQIVTILPKDNFEIMESITPFIAGINEFYADNFFEKYNLTLSDSVLIIDIDKKK